MLVNLYNPNNEAEQVQTIKKVKLGIDFFELLDSTQNNKIPPSLNFDLE